MKDAMSSLCSSAPEELVSTEILARAWGVPLPTLWGWIVSGKLTPDARVRRGNGRRRPESAFKASRMLEPRPTFRRRPRGFRRALRVA